MILNLGTSDIQRYPRLSGAIEFLLDEDIGLIPKGYMPALVEVYFDNQSRPAYTIVSGKVLSKTKTCLGLMPEIVDIRVDRLPALIIIEDRIVLNRVESLLELSSPSEVELEAVLRCWID